MTRPVCSPIIVHSTHQSLNYAYCSLLRYQRCSCSCWHTRSMHAHVAACACCRWLHVPRYANKEDRQACCVLKRGSAYVGLCGIGLNGSAQIGGEAAVARWVAPLPWWQEMRHRRWSYTAVPSGMMRTVGVPCGILAQLVLDSMLDMRHVHVGDM